MSGNPRPKGREYNPKGNLVGTQAFRAVNIAFAAYTLISVGLGYWYINHRLPNSRFYKWIQSDETFNNNAELKHSQAVIEQIRKTKRLAEDPYYMYEKAKEGTASPDKK